MDFLRQAKKLETRVSGAIDRAVQRTGRSGVLDPLEIVHAVVGHIAQEVQPVGRGRHVFPFNRIRVSMAAPSAEARARLAAVVESEPSLQTRVIEQLRAAGCDVSDVTVRSLYVSEPEPHWAHPQWHADLTRSVSAVISEPSATAPLPPAPSPIELTLVRGEASSDVMTFVQPRIEIGRCAEVRDGRNRLLRANHVAFSDADVNHSVSRRHAHIMFDPGSGEYRLYDDGSAQGTSVLRQGRTIAVPWGARGVRLASGDEILLGEARVKVRI